MSSGLSSLMLPVRGGACRLWAGRHLPAASTEALPLLVCHGGPGVPSDYLFPLVEILQRPVIFLTNWAVGAVTGLNPPSRSIRSLRQYGTSLQ